MVSSRKTHLKGGKAMQPSLWQPPVALSEQEEHIVKRIRKAKLFVFLRQQRHELFDEAFQQELAGLYREAERGQPPIAPAMLALALILQASMGISDDEVIEATLMDRRWQLVLDCLDTEQAPWSQGHPGRVPAAAHRGAPGSAAHRTHHRAGKPAPGFWLTGLTGGSG